MDAKVLNTPGQQVATAARSPLALAGLISFAISILMLAVPMFSLAGL